MQRETDTVSLTAREYIANGREMGFSKGALLQAIAEVFEAPAQIQPQTTPVSEDDIRAKWQAFYKEHFNLDVDLSQVVIPDYQPGFDRIIIIAQGLTINQVIEACRKHFNVWTYTEDLDKAVIKNDRSSAEASYAIRIRDRVEADEELKNMSANQLAQENIKGNTLLERLVFELVYFVETGNHLDIDNYTLCSGSRYSGGCVPCVGWGGGGLGVYWYGPGSVVGGLRARSVLV